MQGVFLEHGDCFSSCMKIGEKTINVKGKVKQELGHFTQPLFYFPQHNYNLPPGDWGLHCGGVRGWRQHRLADEADSCPSVDQRQSCGLSHH